MSDLISRQAVLDKFKSLCDVCGDGEKYNGVMCRCCSLDDGICIVEDMPSAEPERNKGVWAGDCCSCCGVSKYNYIKMVDDECEPFGTWNFCPHCGARLEWNHE